MFPPPNIVPPELEDFQWFFNGLLFGADTPVGVLKVEGLDLAAIRSGDVNWPRDHGQARGLDVLEGRDIIFDLWMKTDGESLQATQLELAAATNVRPAEELPLWFKLPNLPVLCVMCRPRKRKIDIESDYAAAQIAKPELALHATDPRIYSAGHEGTIALHEPPTEPETLEVDNEGNTEMRPIAIFTGPLASPYIEAALTGTPRLTFFDNSATETEEAANEKILNEFIREWEIFPENVPLWEVGKKYKKYQFVKLTPGTAKLYWIALQDSEGHEPPGGEHESDAYWESLTATPSTKLPDKLTFTRITELEGLLKAEHEAVEKTNKEARATEEVKGERPTVKAGDQLSVDLGNPHLILYYPGGIEANEPEDAAELLTPTSSWWDIPSGKTVVTFSSIDEKDTGGKAVLQWASARQL
jgi:hypothetical protein